LTFAFIFHIDCLVAVCQPVIKLLLTYLLGSKGSRDRKVLETPNPNCRNVSYR